MKKLIKKILKEVTESILLNEQSSITVNTLDSNLNCHVPILRTCSEDVNQQPYGGNHICRVYQLGCIMKTMTTPYQIGDCFRWDDQANLKVECIVGFLNQKSGRLVRDQKSCVDCGQDTNNNGVDDCIDCDGMSWSGGGWECGGQPNYNCTAMPTTGAGSYDPQNPAPNTYPDIFTCQTGCIPTPIPGCTDTLACNYDSTATTDDGSCTYPGCQDPNAVNNGYQCDGTLGNVGCSGNCCVPITYDCVASGPSTVGGCVAVTSGQGQFTSEDACLTSEGCDRWRCSKNPKAQWGTIGPSACKQCKPWMFNGVWESYCIYPDSTCNNKCSPLIANDDKAIDVPEDCSVEQHEGCWVCHWGAGQTGTPSSCIQLSNLPSGWATTFGTPQGFNYYNTESDCMAAGPECINPKNGPTKDTSVDIAEDVKRMKGLIKY